MNQSSPLPLILIIGCVFIAVALGLLCLVVLAIGRPSVNRRSSAWQALQRRIVATQARGWFH